MPLFVQQLIRGFPAFRCCYTGEWLLYPNNDSPAGLSCFRAVGFHLSWINLDNSGRQRRPIISVGDTLIFFSAFHLVWLIATQEKKPRGEILGKLRYLEFLVEREIRVINLFPAYFFCDKASICFYTCRTCMECSSYQFMNILKNARHHSNTDKWGELCYKYEFSL